MSGNKNNAREAAASVSKDQASPEEVKAALGGGEEQKPEVPADNPNEPTEILGEGAQERSDRHIASTELPVGEVTPKESQDESFDAEEAKELKVAGAASGPKVDGTVRNDAGKVAYAPPGSHNAAVNGVQQDAAGHVDSVGTDNSSKSNTRI